MACIKDYFIRHYQKEPISYEQSYWATIVDPDGKKRNRWEERDQHLDDIKQELQFINNSISGKILDVGCGLGYLLSGVNDNWDKYGVEISQYAASNASKYGKIFCGDLLEANYENEYFDIIVMHHVIEHIEDPIKQIVEIFRVLKPGGIFIIATPDFDSACARRFGENYRLLHDKTHVSLFTNESMFRFLRDHDFIVNRVEYPFFDTRHFTQDNLMRLFDTSKISPAFYGNFMTFYSHKPIPGNKSK